MPVCIGVIGTMFCRFVMSFKALIFIWGCGSAQPTGERIATVLVSGNLTKNGEPLEYYQVLFFPEDGERPAAGTANAEGNFVLGTNEPGDGAVPGTHQVAINWIGPPSDDPSEGIMEFSKPPAPPIKIDSRYADPRTSGIVVEVPLAGTNDVHIDLK